MKKIVTTLLSVLLIALTVGAASVWAQEENGFRRPPVPMGSGICTDGAYLYVLVGHFVFQYDPADGSLTNTVELPAPEPVETTEDPTDEPLRPPPRPMLSGVASDGVRLYVLAGAFIHQYGVPDLVFVNSIKLPEPEAPEN